MSSHRRRRSEIEDDEDSDGEFQPGSIVRVKLTDFVTYESAEFLPGPNLNMVIGPNGTGKSSLVCAICLGLGWGPQHLGRATQIGEFIKHGLDEAYIEIELQRRNNESHNHVVRVRIIREGNNREWWLNGKRTSLKAVQALTRSLSIQIDNLCQFLPQDKVSEFAALSPVELLQQTQRAAAPEQMLEWHEELKKLRKEQKLLEEQSARDKEHLETQETRQDNLRAEVQRLEERNQIQDKVAMLKKTVPFVEYRAARQEYMENKKKKAEAQARLAELKAQIDPTLQSVNHKRKYSDRVSAVVSERKKNVRAVERAAESLLMDIEKLDESIRDIEQKADAERHSEESRRKDVLKIQRKIKDIQNRMQEEPIEFHSIEWNEKISAKQREARGYETELGELQVQEKELREQGKKNRELSEKANQELAALDTQQGQQLSKVESMSKDTAKAWKWIQENQGIFEQEVYGPPLISCSIKDPRYTAAIESLMSRSEILAITAQTKGDLKKLNDQLYGTMRLGDITIRGVTENLAEHGPPPLSASQLQQFGLDGWALDYIDGPEPVLSMLCGSRAINKSAVSLGDIPEEQHNRLLQTQCRCWVVGGHCYRTNVRAEYGSQAASTTTKSVNTPRFWTNQPIDSSAKREIQERLNLLSQNFEALKEQIMPVRTKVNELKAMREAVLEEVKSLKDEKGRLQQLHGQQMEYPRMLEREEKALEDKQKEGDVLRGRFRNLQIQTDHAVLRKAGKALDHKKKVELIRQCHEELLDAEVRLIEAKSDVEALEERNKEIVQMLEGEEQQVREVEQKSKAARDTAAKALKVCQAISAKATPEETEHFQQVPEAMNMEELELEIAAEEAKLDFIHANNPNAIRDFEKRQEDIDKLKEKLTEAADKLERYSRQITKVRSKWEPELDKLVEEISDAFSYNFEQIGCAGQVSIHKDEDFDQWAIQIKVKFRENESLQILDQHRQSGGERSVSTIFYLMSLQSLARAPFRVVDEINQGMDPRNERMVHERMVEIACREHTSQYFLITPKLLTGLRYDRRMKLLCIQSGEYMPEDYKKTDVKSIIAIRRAIVAAR
ncbi:hypothetical protein OIDMADRAFT_104060 [Oidiodendron maius Zn]|uniref:Structural maintenance of chromosomes protein 5 n=1 Tax=Oidiodendron maius (strain Zn) TaxID=913774 RepID=A0A0C3DHP3_OIDMZ|nr:hypothetical protein OIDMADRAFT_104060 [Oidiodendron maius Zn]